MWLILESTLREYNHCSNVSIRQVRADGCTCKFSTDIEHSSFLPALTK